MIIYRKIPEVSGFIFDIDSTLYRNPEYVQHQYDVQIEKLAEVKGKPVEDIRLEIQKIKQSFADQNGGRKISLGNIFLQLGVDIKTSVQWREEYIMPEQFLSADLDLVNTMNKLMELGPVVCVTNNPASIGKRMLRQLGVIDFVIEVLGLDEFYISKPNSHIFEKAFTLLGVKRDAVLAVGDRYAVDLEVPESMGAGAVLVESMKDVYAIPGLILSWQYDA